MRRVASILGPLVVLFALAAPAHATFPGANGKIAFTSTRNQPGLDPQTCGSVCNFEIYVMNPDGTGQTDLSNSPKEDFGFDWSPDGTRLAFTSDRSGTGFQIYVMNADGTGQTRITTNPDDAAPVWSPDGSKIAFMSFRTYPGGNPDGNWQIYVMNADGSNQTRITNDTVFDTGPAWSPNGTKIAFTSNRDGATNNEIYVMNADGTNQTRLTNALGDDVGPRWSPDGTRFAFTSARDGMCCYKTQIYTMNADGTNQTRFMSDQFNDGSPEWSPDGTKIAFDSNRDDPNPNCTRFNSPCNFEVYVANADGSGVARLTTVSGYDTGPAWQSLPRANYPRPQSAQSLSTSLVPLFKQCGAPNSPTNASHAPPLAVGSCNPPSPSSPVARVGAQMQGSAALTVSPGDTDPTNGNQADVVLATSLSDIQTTAGADYNPNVSGADLTQVTRLRLTDQANGYGGTSATADDVDFAVPIDCAPTLDPSVGSTCAVNTSANTLMPGLAQEQRQAVVQVFRVRIYDSGLNGTRENGVGDDKIFAHQGIFVP